MVVGGPSQNVSPEGEQGSFIAGVSTAPGSAIGYTYKRDARYSPLQFVDPTTRKTTNSYFAKPRLFTC